MALLTITTAGLRPLPFRLELEDVIERLIDELDHRDGDHDLEPEEDACLAGDDGCAAVYRHGRLYWGGDQEEGV